MVTPRSGAAVGVPEDQEVAEIGEDYHPYFLRILLYFLEFI